ncbi:cytosolic sulfotransferase 2-like [Clinocottus analis]|uniref:cytosolic sulfotransferase 2-like n=1 Tax=Clinocottus analis TaxID=304258 RepID=UPI0035C0011A
MEVIQPTLCDFHGVSMSNLFVTNWDEVQNFKARPDDILIATYPKAGTTWVCYMLDLLYFGQTCPERQTSISLDDRVPFLEIAKPSLPTGSIIRSGLPNVLRNAKDTAVSYYHFCRISKSMPDPGDWSTFLQNFMEGKVVYGSWHDHVNGWWEKKETYPKIHPMFYEDLIQDTGREIDRLCSFLGLSPSADKMKENKMANFSTVKSMDQKVSPFMRKGKVGDWKNHFTVAQDEKSTPAIPRVSSRCVCGSRCHGRCPTCLSIKQPTNWLHCG